MNAILQIFLSILTAMGGFVEIGELVFAVNAGAKFGPSLIWVVALGTIGIIVYGEMAGRVAAVAKQPIFDWVRERAGFRVGLGTLIAANLVSLMTCTAEIGGIAIVLKLMLGWPYRFLAVIAFVLLLVTAPLVVGKRGAPARAHRPGVAIEILRDRRLLRRDLGRRTGATGGAAQ